MLNNYQIMKYQNVLWNTTYNIKVPPQDVDPFFHAFGKRLSIQGWKTNNNEHDADKILAMIKKPLDPTDPKSSHTMQSYYKMHDLQYLETECAEVTSFSRSNNQYLTIGVKMSNKGVSISWQQKLHPRLGKILGILTIIILFIASLSRLMLPINNIWPLAFFVTGMTVNLGVLLYYIFKFEKDLDTDHGIATAFIDTIMEYEK